MCKIKAFSFAILLPTAFKCFFVQRRQVVRGVLAIRLIVFIDAERQAGTSDIGEDIAVMQPFPIWTVFQNDYLNLETLGYQLGM